MSEPVPARIGNYEVIRERARTASAQLFEAAEPAHRRTVTIAVSSDTDASDEVRVREFWDEALKLGELRHPNIARVIDRGRDGDQLYLVEEHVPGVELVELMRSRRLSVPEALMVFTALCNALEAAHERGVVHHDLTPAHVLVSEDLAVVKLRGFGLRHSSQRRADGTTVATTRTVFTGLSYMSPEQAKHLGAVDARSNVYSIGVIFYELLTGRVPRGRFQLPSQLNSEVPSDIDALVLKCVAARPEERFPSVAELKRRLAALQDQLRLGILHELQGLQRSTAKILRRHDEGPSTATEIAAAPPPVGKSPALLIAIGAAVLLAVLIAVFLLTR